MGFFLPKELFMKVKRRRGRMVNYRCSVCGRIYSYDTLEFRCECGGIFDLEDFDFKFSKEDIIREEWSLFRYLRALPFTHEETSWRDITLGEGFTGVVPLDRTLPEVLVKMDFMMPTLSFKDRGAAVLVSRAREIGVKKIVQDSSGNAGNSIAAYAGRAGIPCDIYVPEGTSQKKIDMIRSHGAQVKIIPGSREDTARAVLIEAEKEDVFYASHVYNPLFYQGTKTYVYEIYEQLGSPLPEHFIVPVGNGTLLLGCYYGFKDLLRAGLIERMPRIIAVQSARCAPIYKAFVEGRDTVEEIEGSPTLAEGIAIAAPMRGRHILQAIRESRGDIILAPEEKILSTRDYLAEKGFYVEPTTAATFAGYFHSEKPLDGRVIIPLCGAGLKSSK